MNLIETVAPIFMLICAMIGTISALLFMSIVIFHRRCHTTHILLVFNSSIAGLIINVTSIAQAIYHFIDYDNDPLCSFRGLILMAGTSLFYHTLCVQALYRLFATVLSTKRYLASTHCVICLVCIQWIFTITFGIPILATGRITYRAASRLCLVSMSDIFSFIYFGMFTYPIPILLINCIYMRIVKYMKQTSLTSAVRRSIAERQRQKREIRLIRRILMLVTILVMMGLPYLVFFILFQFNQSLVPSYVDTMCSLFIGFGLSVSMLFNIITTHDVRKILFRLMGIKKRNYQRTIIHISDVSFQKVALVTEG